VLARRNNQFMRPLAAGNGETQRGTWGENGVQQDEDGRPSPVFRIERTCAHPRRVQGDGQLATCAAELSTSQSCAADCELQSLGIGEMPAGATGRASLPPTFGEPAVVKIKDGSDQLNGTGPQAKGAVVGTRGSIRIRLHFVGGLRSRFRSLRCPGIGGRSGGRGPAGPLGRQPPRRRSS